MSSIEHVRAVRVSTDDRPDFLPGSNAVALPLEVSSAPPGPVSSSGSAGAAFELTMSSTARARASYRTLPGWLEWGLPGVDKEIQRVYVV